MDPQEWLAFINQHKGIVGHVPYRTKAEQDGVVDPNAKPPMDLVFGDGSSMQAIFEDDGSVTVTKPLKSGPKAGQAKGPTAPGSPSEQFLAQTDPATGQTTWVPNPNYVDPSTKPPTPKDTVPGTGTTATPGTLDQNGDPIGATPGTPDLSVDVYGAQTARQNAENTAKNDAAARAIGQQNADTSSANSAANIQQNAIQNARQAAQDAWQRGQADIQNQLAQGRLSLDQAQLAASNLHAQISEDLQRSAQALTARGQDLNYLGNQSYVTKGQYESLQGAEGQLAQTGGVGFTPSPTPPGLGYDPAQLAASLAQQALGQTQQPNQPFSLGQAPAQPAGPGFIAPRFSMGGQVPVGQG